MFRVVFFKPKCELLRQNNSEISSQLLVDFANRLPVPGLRPWSPLGWTLEYASVPSDPLPSFFCLLVFLTLATTLYTSLFTI